MNAFLTCPIRFSLLTITLVVSLGLLLPARMAMGSEVNRPVAIATPTTPATPPAR